MVQHNTSSSSDEIAAPQIPEIPAKGIPVGKYRLVGWAVDTTGRRLIDEIVHLSGYTPDSKFSQYIMPFSNLNPMYSHKYNIRIFNVLRFRRLKDMRTGQFLKTKSEFVALTDFVQWLETVKGETEGVILIFHEVRKTTPGMLLEAMRRNNLLERFEKVCKGFANGFSIAKAKCQSSTKTYNLRIMGKVLLGRENVDFSNAAERASAIYDIAVHLAQEGIEEIDIKGKSTGTESDLIQLVCPYTNPISAEEEEIETFKVLLQRQNTFRPVFGALMRASPPERQHASHLRRLLAENNINYDKLKEAYEKDAKEGLDKILKDEIANAKEADITELLEILDCFFDPDKQPVKPKTTWYRFGYRRPRPKSFNKNRHSSSRSKKTSESKDGSGTNGNNTSSGSDNVASNESSPRAEKGQEQQPKVEVPAN
ncbi:hypothetical protein ABEB36_003308 [Hypothenemus hampei]|uniref:Exuperantia SAM-like domain-containing protein n=1 Tax=Hypothenemus hampei TaxID=57062 RepID=A0ABD1F8R2_HYPHA